MRDVLGGGSVRSLRVLLPTAVVLVGVVGVSVAAIPDSSGQIHVCYSAATTSAGGFAQPLLYDPQQRRCPAGLTAVAINQSGARGLKGDPGPPGPQGLVGATGPGGVTGATGLAGANGDTGAAGPQGVQGVKGDTGATGSPGAAGVVGPAGPTGAPGTAGSPGTTGPQGLPGVKGDTGPTGSPGVQGADGPTGATGANGIPGTPGATGEPGPQGPQGLQGYTGYTGAMGADGPQGLQGVKGDTGAAGSPGVKGDTGAAGTPGTTGAPGVQGDTGPPGPSGPGGSPGPQGPQGTQGPIGATGPAAVAQYAYVNNTNSETVPPFGDITFSGRDVLSSGIHHIPGSAQIGFDNAGTYKVSFSVSAVDTNRFGLAINGSLVFNSVYAAKSGNEQNTGQAIIQITAGANLTLRSEPESVATANLPTTETTVPSTNASVVIEKLG